MTPDSSLQPGTTLQNGKYTIVRPLGQGSFGITYLARMKFRAEGSLGAMEVEGFVCIKEFFMSDVNRRHDDGSSVRGTDSSQFAYYCTKFRHEAENLHRLKHSNIVKVYDVFDQNDTTYYVMEYIEGQNLDEYIKQRGRLDAGEVRDVATQVGRAIQYMHSLKMLHLDIKPKNVMRSKDSRHYLIDFGLSKHIKANGEPETSTTIGLGTPGYAPLEQANYKADGQFPATLDVYAFGATLYRMLTGQRPPEASAVLNDGLPGLDGVDQKLAAVVRKAMSPLTKHRYPTIDALLADLTGDDTVLSNVGSNDDTDVTVIVEKDNTTPPVPQTHKTPGNKPKPRSDNSQPVAPAGNSHNFAGAFAFFAIITVWTLLRQFVSKMPVIELYTGMGVMGYDWLIILTSIFAICLVMLLVTTLIMLPKGCTSATTWNKTKDVMLAIVCIGEMVSIYLGGSDLYYYNYKVRLLLSMVNVVLYALALFATVLLYFSHPDSARAKTNWGNAVIASLVGLFVFYFVCKNCDDGMFAHALRYNGYFYDIRYGQIVNSAFFCAVLLLLMIPSMCRIYDAAAKASIEKWNILRAALSVSYIAAMSIYLVAGLEVSDLLEYPFYMFAQVLLACTVMAFYYQPGGKKIAR